MTTCGKSVTGQHSIRFHKPRILANAVPLGFCCGGFSSTAGYVPATKLNFRRATRPLRRVLAKGSHSFLSEWFKKVSRPTLAEPFGSDSGCHRINSRLPFLSPDASPHRSPVPSSVSKAVTFVTRALYPKRILRSIFFVFYFFENVFLFFNEVIGLILWLDCLTFLEGFDPSRVRKRRQQARPIELKLSTEQGKERLAGAPPTSYQSLTGTMSDKNQQKPR